MCGLGGGTMWPNIIKRANSLLLFVDIIYIFTEIVREGFVPSLKGGGQIEEIIKEILAANTGGGMIVFCWPFIVSSLFPPDYTLLYFFFYLPSCPPSFSRQLATAAEKNKQKQTNTTTTKNPPLTSFMGV